MTKERQIVLMLLRRKRQAFYQYRKACASRIDNCYAAYNEAHNAAELARRILYDKPLFKT